MEKIVQKHIIFHCEIFSIVNDSRYGFRWYPQTIDLPEHCCGLIYKYIDKNQVVVLGQFTAVKEAFDIVGCAIMLQG